MTALRSLASLMTAAVAISACSGKDGDGGRNQPRREEQRPRRVIEPPVGTVRPLPPHLISSSGVGPYHLGDRLSDLMQQLPSGPRMALFEIPGVLHRNVLRAEEGDSVLVGGEPGAVASFIAIIDAKVARTETGLHVGATREDVEALGPAASELDRARDPRIAMLPAPKGVKVLFTQSEAPRDAQSDKKGSSSVPRVGAIVVASDSRTTPPPNAGGCTRPVPTAPLSAVRAGRVFGACLSGAAPGEVVQVTEGELIVRAPGSDKPLFAPIRLPAGVVFVAPLRIDERDELVIVMRSEQATARVWSVFAWRMEGGKFFRSTDEPTVAYTVTSDNARWIGVELSEIDLMLEIAATKDSVELTGLLVTQVDVPTPGVTWRDIVVISPVPLPRRPAKTVLPEGSGSGEGSARPQGIDAGSPGAMDASSAPAP